jgi:hypothetical protein
MVTGLHKRTPKETGAEAILRFRWQKALETRLNAALNTVWTAFRRVPGSEGYVRNGELLSSELSNYEAAEIAKQEWLWALAYFHEVSEPGLVDYAVYSLQAAERKYMYLLEKAREEYASIT